MKTAVGTKMNFKLIFLGLIFFFNPNVGLFDFLPDFLGCILILCGLSKLRDIDERFFEARKASFWLLASQLLKVFLLLYTMFYANDNSLPFTFMYSVAEMIILMRFFICLFNGIEYCITRHDGEKHLAYSKTASTFTYIFVIAKSVLTFIPESLSLWNVYDEEGRIILEPMRIYKPYITLLCFVAVFALGVCFVAVLKKYLLPIYNDNPLQSKLLCLYNTNLSDNPKLLTRRNFKTALNFLFAGNIFLFDLTIDGINLLPNFIAFLFMSLGLFYLQSHINRKRTFFIPLSLMLFSVISYILKTFINISYNHALSIESFFSKRYAFAENGEAIYWSLILSLTEQILYVYFVFLIIKWLKQYADATGVKYTFSHETLGLKITSVIMAVLCVVCYTLPAVTTYLYYKAQSLMSSPAHHIIAESAALCDNISEFAGAVLIITKVITLYCFIKIKKHFEFQY